MAGQNQVGPYEDGRRHAQAHDHAGGIDKDARAQFAPDHDPFVRVDFVVEFLEITLFLVGGTYLAHVFQRLLDAVGYAHRSLFCPFRATAGELARAEQQAECYRYAPQTGEHQPPIVGQKANRDDRRGDIGAIQIAQHMRPDMFHAVHVAHQRLRQVGQIALAKVPQRQLAQPLCQVQTTGFDLVVYQAIGRLVLLQVRCDGQYDKGDHQGEHKRQIWQRLSGRERTHKAGHHQIKDTHTGHDGQIDDDRPECALSDIAHPLLGQGVFALKLLSEHLLCLLFARDLPLRGLIVIRPHAGIGALCGEQLRMRALLDNASRIEHDDFVRANDG